MASSSDRRPAPAGDRAEASRRPRASKPAEERNEGALAPGLHVVATPIGNARDLTLRALDVLAACDAVACEDTRVTARLLAMHGLKRPLISYREENAAVATPALLARIAQGEAIALVSDAGTPQVSDPGLALADAVWRAGGRVYAVPGPSALTAALSIAGIGARRTLFAGFLPARAAERRAELQALKGIDAALAIYEAPHRIAESLADMAVILGPRPAALCRELTKTFEEVRRASLPELAAMAAAEPNLARGEIALVIAPPPAGAAAADGADVDAALRAALATMRVKDAADAVAGALGLARREVYARALALKEEA